MKLTCALVITVTVASGASALEVQSGTGDTVKIDLGYSTFINEKSSLQRRWTIVNDPALPVKIDAAGFKGFSTGYGSAVGYLHRASFDLEAAAPISAVRIITLPFDVWNEPSRPLSLTKLADIGAGLTRVEGEWRTYDESEASTLLATLSFVESVRLMDGTVMHADLTSILEEARKLNDQVSADDLQPTPPAQNNPAD